MAIVSTTSPASGDACVSSVGQQPSTTGPLPLPKKKRSLPGMPDPDAEVVALSPKTLLTTNRFVCEICKKGFQRDQNLQLHRRGHNLPWKLRQRTGKEPRKRVYVCPEPTCIHHDPSRALGDLTGIKKHFCRKHGEKKWKCDKCSKKYAVQSDWKAHSKTCGTREYRCDCGTLFSRRDSFITHRAFCDVLAVESAKTQTAANSAPEEGPTKLVAAAAGDGIAAESSSPSLTSEVLAPIHQREPTDDPILSQAPTPTGVVVEKNATTNCSSSDGSSGSLFSRFFASTACSLQPPTSAFSDLLGALSRTAQSNTTPAPPEPTSLCLSSIASGSHNFFSQTSQDRMQFAPPPSAHMSATALLQKAAQMGAAASNSRSFLRSLGISTSSSTENETSLSNSQVNLISLWPPVEPIEPAGLGLGSQYESLGLRDFMATQTALFGPKPTTLDLLGLGMGGGAGPGGGLSALITSIGDGGPFNGGDSAAASKSRWEGPDKKPDRSALM